ncbi:MAG TPA: hypothetical protein VFQ12_08625 [Thermoleophilaceae bacterium]|nr:hypothetical protein [Thermoleophilaceae bacterium]
MLTQVHGRGRGILLAATLLLAAPATAAAVHWPHAGGDAGRSGNQPVGDGTPPVRALYAKTEAVDRNVQTAIVTTSGAAGLQRFAYGTADGRIHVRLLASGAAIGPAGGIVIDDGEADADVLGAPGATGLVDTSGSGGLGQLLVVHNDDGPAGTGDIAIAQIDESTGALVKQVPVAGTDGFSMRSSPVATAPDASGDRALFFVAESGEDQRLFRVPVANAADTAASFGAPIATADIDAVPEASPAVVWLRDAAGGPVANVAVGTGAPVARLRTFAASDLAPGPASEDLGDAVQTPTVPVQADGSTPNAGGRVKSAPAVYVAATSGTATAVHRLTQAGNAQSLTLTASSPRLAGAPAPALATDVESGPSGPTSGRVVVTTEQNLYVLDGGTLALGPRLSETPLAPGTTGFSQTSAALANGFGYVTTDDGRQLVVKLTDAQPVAADEFSEHAANGRTRPARSAFGQPSVSRSFVQFAGPGGAFVYTNRCGNPVSGSDGADRILGTPAGEEVEARGGNDEVNAAGGDDCLFGGAGSDRLFGDPGDDRVSAGSGSDRVIGGSGDDALSGNGEDDRVSGGSGDDVVYGRSGDDGVSGNSGEDVVRGGLGDDRVFGRSGDDVLSGNSGSDRVSAGGGDDKVFGRSGDDGVSGNSGDDRVSGGSGDDRVFGRSGDDGVSGNAGDDRVFGGSGRDRLFGRAGDDRIHSRDGVRDLVYCGPGRDTAIADREDLLRGCERVFRR